MAGPLLPISSPADYAIQLEILRKIESLGGSARYAANPDAFSDFAAALDPFKLEVWTKSIDELAKHEDNRSAQALKRQLQAELDLQHSDPESAQKQRISNIIKGIESLGGSVGFQKFTENPYTTLSKANEQAIAASTGSSSCYSWGFVASAWFITTLVLYAEDHSGTGYAWGPALGVGNLQGILTYDNFNADGFSFQNTGPAALAWMTLGGTLTSHFAGVLFGVSVAFSFDGNWHW